MNDLLLQVSTLNQSYYAFITWAGVLLFLFIVLLCVKPALNQKWKEWRMLRCINNTSQELMKDVFLPDGMEGMHFFPFIILSKKAIILLKTMQFRGIIFAAENIDFWTQVLGKRSYKFHNPMPGLEAEMASIRALDKKIVVEGRVVFTSDSNFPKGRPEAVMLETELKAYLEEMMQGESSANLMQSWELLKRAAAEGVEDRLLMSKSGTLTTTRIRMAWLFMLLAVAWGLIRVYGY